MLDLLRNIPGLNFLMSCCTPAQVFATPTPSTIPRMRASSGDHQSCPADSPWSCSAGTQDCCCYEGTNGVFLQTQFWDYAPATGPNDAWTIHGLWNDKCSGGYEQYCNPSWEVDSAKSTLEGLGLDDLVQRMNTVWKNQGNSDDDLWTHEFNKHGTCMSTVNPSCYGDAPANTNVGDFFKRVISLYDELPTYQWLADAGIIPSTDRTFTVKEFSDALESHVDSKKVYLGCDRKGNINELWYFYELKGSVADGTFKHMDSITTSSCTDGFHYLPKGSGGGDDNDDTPATKGYLNVTSSGGSQKGCLISDGSWYISGTCATFGVVGTVGGVSVTSSKGPCNVIDSKFTCGSSVTTGDFELKNNQLTYSGSSFSADHAPAANEKVAVMSGNGKVDITLELTA